MLGWMWMGLYVNIAGKANQLLVIIINIKLGFGW